MTYEFTMPRFDGEAACAEIDPDGWFPESGGEGLIAAENARRVCKGCEVLDQCLTWAIDNSELHGIWGGLTRQQRKRLRRRAA